MKKICITSGYRIGDDAWCIYLSPCDLAAGIEPVTVEDPAAVVIAVFPSPALDQDRAMDAMRSAYAGRYTQDELAAMYMEGML